MRYTWMLFCSISYDARLNLFCNICSRLWYLGQPIQFFCNICILITIGKVIVTWLPTRPCLHTQLIAQLWSEYHAYVCYFGLWSTMPEVLFELGLYNFAIFGWLYCGTYHQEMAMFILEILSPVLTGWVKIYHVFTELLSKLLHLQCHLCSQRLCI